MKKIILFLSAAIICIGAVFGLNTDNEVGVKTESSIVKSDSVDSNSSDKVNVSSNSLDSKKTKKEDKINSNKKNENINNDSKKDNDKLDKDKNIDKGREGNLEDNSSNDKKPISNEKLTDDKNPTSNVNSLKDEGFLLNQKPEEDKKPSNDKKPEEDKKPSNDKKPEDKKPSSDKKPSNDKKPQETESNNKKEVATIAINAQKAIDYGINKKDGFTHLPSNGVILSPQKVEFKEGDTVFDVLSKIVKAKGIQMEYTGAGSAIYIQGIDNLYEFDCGKYSGWMYEVNGWYPNYGVGAYKLKPGDNIVFNYTCDLGKDLGAPIG